MVVPDIPYHVKKAAFPAANVCRPRKLSIILAQRAPGVKGVCAENDTGSPPESASGFIRNPRRDRLDLFDNL